MRVGGSSGGGVGMIAGIGTTAGMRALVGPLLTLGSGLLPPVDGFATGGGTVIGLAVGATGARANGGGIVVCFGFAATGVGAGGVCWPIAMAIFSRGNGVGARGGNFGGGAIGVLPCIS